MNGTAQTTGSNAVVRMKGVEVTYTSNPKPVFKGGFRLERKSVTVFEEIDLEIRKGDFTTIVGPSGCGKSTLFRLILGSQFPTRGEVFVKGEPVRHVTPRTGIVYQRYSLFPHLTVADNIALGPLVRHTGVVESLFRSLGPRYRRILREARAEAYELLTHVGMKEDDGRKYPQELSGGMQQRVAIAQATIMKPEVLLMDEPFGALDLSTREDMQLFIREQAREHNLTVIFVTHDLDEALFLGSRILGLSQYWNPGTGEKKPSARIVTDRDLNRVIGDAGTREATVIDAPEFRALRRKVHQDVLDANHLQTAAEFDIDPRP